MSLKTLTYDRLLICEGIEDYALVTQMIANNRAPAMDHTFIGINGGGYGITGLKAFLESLPGVVGFSNLRRIGILADNDDAPNEMMDYIRQMFAEANTYVDVNYTYSVPLQPLVRATERAVSTIFIPLPGTHETGCLETLLLRILQNLHGPKKACVDQAIQCSNIELPPESWNRSRIDKAKVRAAIAIINQSNPGVQLSKVWRESPDLMPVTHTEFDALSGSLYAI